MTMSFGSMDDLFAYASRLNNEASLRLHDEQRKITFGSYAVSLEQNLITFAHFFTEEEYMNEELAAGAMGDDALEGWQQLVEAETHDRLFGRVHSWMAPDGNLATTHRINFWPIDEATFDWAQECSFDPQAFPTDLFIKVYEDSLIQLAGHLQPQFEGR